MNEKLIVKLIVVYLFITSFCNAQKTNVELWVNDIDFYHKTLETKHIDLYHTISKEEFTFEIRTIKERLPELTDFQVIVELMRLTHKIGAGLSDGHTSVPLWGTETNKFPIELFDFGNELRVVKTTKLNKHLLGKKLKSIEGVSIDKIYSMVSELTPFTENKQSSMVRTCSYMMVAEILEAIEIVKNKTQAEFGFVDENGNEERITLKSYSKELLNNFQFETLPVLNPIINRPKDSPFKDLWFTSLDDSKTIYISFKEFPKAESEMNTFSEGVYDFIEKNQSKNLIIDLRGNYGGDLFMGLILGGWLNVSDSIIWKSNVYVLIDRVTYSAAMVNAVQFKQLLNAKVIGEPTGANPNGYQDLGQFKLPNSNLLITYTKRLFRLQDESTFGLQPDVFIIPKWISYKNGVDEVLEWVLKDIRN